MVIFDSLVRSDQELAQITHALRQAGLADRVRASQVKGACPDIARTFETQAAGLLDLARTLERRLADSHAVEKVG